MKHTKSHVMVDLSDDLRDERADYLNMLLLITSIVSVLFYVIFNQFPSDKLGGLNPRAFIAPLLGCAASYVMLKQKRVDSAAYVYLAGLTFWVSSS